MGSNAVRSVQATRSPPDSISSLEQSQVKNTVRPEKTALRNVCQRVGSLKANPGAIR